MGAGVIVDGLVILLFLVPRIAAKQKETDTSRVELDRLGRGGNAPIELAFFQMNPDETLETRHGCRVEPDGLAIVGDGFVFDPFFRSTPASPVAKAGVVRGQAEGRQYPRSRPIRVFRG